MAFPRGDVVLVPFPFTNLSTSKLRPAVILNSAAYQKHEPDLIFAAITSRIPPTPSPMDYVLADWQQAGLKKPSVVKTVLFTLHPSLIVHSIGRLTAQDATGLGAVLRSALEL